jgi:hypothetical protein
MINIPSPLNNVTRNSTNPDPHPSQRT